MATPSVPRTMMNLWRHADTRQSLYRAPCPGSKRRRIVLQQRPPHQLDGRETLLHEGVMEILEPKGGPLARLVALLDEEVARLLQRHLAGVQLDADDVARITQQRIAQLTQAQQSRLLLVDGAHARLPVALIEHHLLV